MLPFFYANVGGETIEGALALQRLPGQGGAPPGLILEPRLPSEMPLDFQLGAVSADQGARRHESSASSSASR